MEDIGQLILLKKHLSMNNMDVPLIIVAIKPNMTCFIKISEND